MSKLKLAISLSVFVSVFTLFGVIFTDFANAASLTNSSVTLSNTRMSYKALISSGAAGSSLITINSGTYPDRDTDHLFPGDAICFTDAGNNVCRDNKTYTVANIINATSFNLTAPLTTALTATDYAVATQSGAWTIGFTTVGAIPVGGKIVLTIPANDANTTAQNNDGMPDSASGVSTNGFDMNELLVGNATVTAGCTPGNWSAATIVLGGGGTTDTTISWTRNTTSCAGGTAITLAIASPFIANPAPITTGHTQGTADVYGIKIDTTDGANIIDTASPKVAPVEAVLISANVDESLSLVVSGLGAGTYCGKSQTITTTATSIPWGHLAAANTFYYAAQTLTVNTNATSGYTVTIQENDQMGKNGNTCTGTTPSSGDYTFSAGTCIRDTVCSATTPCTESVMGDWTVPTGFAGLGYSVASISGTDAPFFYNQGGRTWNSKQLADVTQGGETAQSIMGNSGPVSGSSIYVCYTITIPGTQPSGYYYNIAKYTATATF